MQLYDQAVFAKRRSPKDQPHPTPPPNKRGDRAAPWLFFQDPTGCPRHHQPHQTRPVPTPRRRLY
jgi:hypothetical protein